MATTASVRIVKSFLYRGSARLWSNRYHFDGTTPPDSTHWTTLCDAIVTAEKAQYMGSISSSPTIVEAVGYAAGSEIPVFTKTYSTAASGAFSNAGGTPGDVAFVVRYSTADRSSKNHPVYLFSYYHSALYETGGPYDTMNVNQRTAAGTYAAAWITGFSDGAVTHHRCRPTSTSLATGSLVEPLLSHRDLVR